MKHEFSDTQSYNPTLVSNQLKALVGRNVQHYFSSLNEVMVKYNGVWGVFEDYNKVFKVL